MVRERAGLEGVVERTLGNLGVNTTHSGDEKITYIENITNNCF